MTSATWRATLSKSKLLGLEVLASEGSRLAVKVGLSITIVAGSAQAIATAVIAPIASIL